MPMNTAEAQLINATRNLLLLIEVSAKSACESITIGEALRRIDMATRELRTMWGLRS